MFEFDKTDELIAEFERVVKNPVCVKSSFYYTGVDLGTACVVVAVLDDQKKPVAGEYCYADVVRDGMVVDYIGAIDMVRGMKGRLEQRLGAPLPFAAAAIPPGTGELDGGAVKNVVAGAGFEVTNVLDEPSAANEVLGLRNGAVVDIGGGTTGIAVLKDGEVIYAADEATGGTHFSLVVAGAKKMRFEEAELYKRDPAHHAELLPVLRPVIDKVSAIIASHIAGYAVDNIVLVGGACCLKGIEKVIEDKLGVRTHKPENPLFVTPLGIALSCKSAG